uniref:Ribulose-phosphate 3-epimerase n=2 Tax=Candidatus Bipolaricaulota TaxID=67810 RepID=H5S9Y0_9BACT|nr:ribulose-phosphate 3-epimerase [uncultured Acetothermia bacterium]BAL59234.1 ribulose-phosphate 3-epimerase [Candidatus Acetothermum autotrophicum]
MKLAPSLLAADCGRLLDQAQEIADLSDYLHWDVMDGHFVPNLTFGPVVVNALRARVSTPFDIHLMITDPQKYAPQFAVRPGDLISFHGEAVADPVPVIEMIRTRGARAGIALRPKTPLSAVEKFLDQIDFLLIMSVEPGFAGQSFIPETLEKIRHAKELIRRKNLSVEIEVDGGVNAHNIKEIARAGVDIIVAASAIFGQSNPRKALAELRALAIS